MKHAYKTYFLILLATFFAPNVWSIQDQSVRPSFLSFLSRVIGIDQITLQEASEDLDYYSSRSIDITMPWHPLGTVSNAPDSASFTIGYKARWGYKGAGKPNEPFQGFKGTLSASFNYDGISIDPCKSRSLKTKIEHYAAPLLSISPIQEFFFKCAQLLWTEAQKETVDLEQVSNEIHTLLARLKITHGAATLRIQGIRLIGSQQQPGFDTFFHQAPKQITEHIIAGAKKLFRGIGLITAQTQDPESLIYLKRLLAQIDYFNNTTVTITLPKGGTLSIPFEHAGSGPADTPFALTQLTITVPSNGQNGNAGRPVKWLFTIHPDSAFLIRLCLLLLENKKGHLPHYRLFEEISTLFSRLACTPTRHHGRTLLSDGLRFIGTYHQELMHHDFSAPPTEVFNTADFIRQLLCIMYRAYTQYADYKHSPSDENQPQTTADFITKECAYALRQYRGFLSLKDRLASLQFIKQLNEKHGVTLDANLFLTSLLPPAE